jgi:transposase
MARRFDVIRIEDLKIRTMTRSAKGTIAEPGVNVRAKAGMNREILASGWGLLARRLEDKARGRVERIRPHYTSQTCNACGHCEQGNRKSQAFLCLACGHSDHADVNAAKNIAGGYPVTARGGSGKLSGPVNREPQAA